MPDKRLLLVLLFCLSAAVLARVSSEKDPYEIFSLRDYKFILPVMPANAYFNDKFEGTLHYELDINGLQQDFRYKIKKGFVRLEIDDPYMGGTMTILISPIDDRMIILMHEVHAFSELAFEDFSDQTESLFDRMERVIETENRKSIAGIECREFLITTEKEEMIRLWTPLETTRYGKFQFPDFDNRLEFKTIKQELPDQLFPFAVSYQGKKNSVEITLLRIQEEELNPDLFTIPANYNRISLIMPD